MQANFGTNLYSKFYFHCTNNISIRNESRVSPRILAHYSFWVKQWKDCAKWRFTNSLRIDSAAMLFDQVNAAVISSKTYLFKIIVHLDSQLMLVVRLVCLQRCSVVPMTGRRGSRPPSRGARWSRGVCAWRARAAGPRRTAGTTAPCSS